MFGIRTLDFRFDVSKGQEADFLTADIFDYIECRTFLAAEYGKAPYMPGKRYDDKLDDYCFETSGMYLIPLYLLVGSSEHDDRLRKKRLLAIIKNIKDRIVESITTYHDNLDPAIKESFAFSVIIETVEQNEYRSAIDKDSIFADLVEDKADLWEDYFQKYLYSCVEKLKLNKIEMPEGSRARAIDIYENMDMGGMSLSTLDLVAARVVKISQEPLYDRILQYLVHNKKCNMKAIPNEIKNIMPRDYNPSTAMKVVDGRVAQNCSDLFLELLGLYCNNKEYDPNEVKCVHSKSTKILKLSEKEIDENCMKVCIAIDRAFCFYKCVVELEI